jgi:photosystem II stability/assembly factor-like uncharacterized protein
MRAMRTLALIILGGLASSAHAEIRPDTYQELRWRMVGPFRGGRTKGLAGVPSRPGVFYTAQVNGGVWKTDDYGRSWRPIFDDQPTQSVGAIAVALSNPDVIYVGSGEGLHRPDLSVGNGMYKSVDGGATWKHLGLPDAQQIGQLAVDPRNPNRVFAAVLGHPFGPSEQRGVYRSLDGGASWQRVLYKSPSVGGYDVEIDPQNPQIVYAGLWENRLAPWEDRNHYPGTNGGLFKSTDGGTTWKKLAGGLPANGVQFDVAIAPSRPSRLYVTLTTLEEHEYGTGKGTGLFRSDDAGATWVDITTDERPQMKIGGGDLMVPTVDPKNPDVVYVSSIVAMKSADGGKTWTWLRGAPGGDDYQNAYIDPRDPRIIALASDQGTVITVNGGATWSSWYNQPTAQLYHVAATADFPYKVCGGQQESGSVCISSRGGDGTIGYRDWRPVGIIEYGYAAPDPRDPDVVYGAGRAEVTRYRWSTGLTEDITPIPVRGKHRVERTQPIAFSPVDPSRMYYAAEVLFETRDRGQTWRAISGDLAHPKPGVPPSVGAVAASDKRAADARGAIYSLALSYKSAATIWAGTDDGKIWITRDGGKQWTDITPPAVTPWSKVTQLDASRFDDTTVYASVSRLRVDDLAPYIYKTADGGKTWTAIVGGLPPGPVNAVRADPVRRGLLFASTENGVWVSFDDGAKWQALQLNLPRSSARDIIVHGDDLIVATHGRGFWILDDIAPLRQVAAAMPDTLFAPPAAYRLPRSSYTDTPVPPDEPWAENPPAGAILDYYLAQPSATPVTLEIVDGKGAVVRRFSSVDPPEVSDAELAKQMIPSYWARPHRVLPTAAGMHRWVWDLRRDRPLADNYGYPINAVPRNTPRRPEGPRVAPGTYTVRLTASGKALTAKVVVKADPRVKLAAGVLAQQNQLETRLAEQLTRASQLTLEARSISDQLAKLAAPEPLKAQLAELATKVTALRSGTKDRADPVPTLAGVAGKIQSLYGATDVDAAPTAVLIAEAAKAERELDTLAKSWAALKANELARANAALTAAKLPPLAPDGKPALRDTSGDEE